MMSQQSYILDYSYPDFGLVSVPFYNESKEVIEFLEKTEKDGLRHFERLDHLGRIRDTHKSAHHSRWEYMFLQMYLFHAFKETGATFGFSGSIKLDKDNRISSAEELLKCWTLLLNFGHLEGTFESEKAWFEILKDDKDAYDAFLDNLPDLACRKITQGIFDDENYYKLHEIFTLLILKSYKGSPEFSSRKIDKFILIVKRYLLDNPRATAINRCKSLFRRIRKIAYIVLDCAFSGSFMKINPKIFFDYILNNSDEVLYEDYSNFNKILDSMAIQLFNELYASKEVTSLKLQYVRKKKHWIKETINADRADLAAQLAKGINQSKHSDPIELTEQESQHLLRLAFFPSGEYFERSDCKYYSEEKRLTQKLGVPTISTLVTPDLGFTGSILDVFLDGSLNVQQLPRFIWTLLKYTDEVFADWRFEDYLFQTCVEDPAEEIFLFLVNLLFSSSRFKIRLKEVNSPDDYNVNLLIGKASMEKWITRITEDMRDSDLAPNRIKELECLKTMIRKEKSGTLIVSHCNVGIHDHKWSEKAEWDGVYFRVLPQAIYLNVLEAKAGMTVRSERAKNDLLDSFHKVGLKIDASKTPIQTASVKGKGVGFSYLKANFKDLLPSEIIW